MSVGFVVGPTCSTDFQIRLFQIPFSKFYLSAKGRIQDKQEAIQLSLIRWLGITLADAVTGPFQLEIDYIAVVYDSTHPHSFEYEMYPVSPTVFS
jgi:NADH dehydrogenase [ubiquinone] 1 alpha subcomplex assembly factor 1